MIFFAFSNIGFCNNNNKSIVFCRKCWEDLYCLYLILLSPKIEKRFCRPNLQIAQFLNEPRSAQVQGLLLILQYQVVALSLTPWSGLPELGSGLSAQF